MDGTALEASVNWLVARTEIVQQIYRMGYFLEDGDFDGVADLLADATFGADILGRKAFRGRQEIGDQYRRTNVTYPDRGRATKEVYSNVLVDIDLDAGTARSITSYTVAQQPPGEVFELIVAGRYEDEWKLADGSWKWTDRYIKVQFRNDLTRHMNPGSHPWQGDGRDS
jgi:hypothetical protein